MSNKQTESLLPSARDIISKIDCNRANLEYIAKTGKINGSLLIDLEKAFKEAMIIARDTGLELAASNPDCTDIGIMNNNGEWPRFDVVKTDSILSLKEDDRLKVH